MYTAYLTHPAGTFTGSAENDHEAVMLAYNALKAAWSIDPWEAKVVVYLNESLSYACKSFMSYHVNTI